MDHISIIMDSESARRETIDEPGLAALVDAFYTRVRADPLIGPVFTDAIGDWPHHLAALTDFWSSVMTGSGRYKGRPMPAHFRHRARITPAMFDRWLALWRETTEARFAPGAAAAFQDKAERIAESLKLGLFFTMPTVDRPPAEGR